MYTAKLYLQFDRFCGSRNTTVNNQYHFHTCASDTDITATLLHLLATY